MQENRENSIKTFEIAKDVENLKKFEIVKVRNKLILGF